MTDQTLISLLADIARQQRALKEEADRLGISPFHLRTPDGNWSYLPLLVAEANARLALAMAPGVITSLPPAPTGPPCDLPACIASGRTRPCNGPHDCAQM